MRAAKRLGMQVLLELPGSHPVVWEQTVRRAYETFPLRALWQPLYPTAHIQRMQAELEVADRIHVLSSFVLQQFLELGVPREKVALLPLGVDHVGFSPPKEPPASSSFRFLYVGRIEPLKGIHYVLEAFVRLKLPKAELWLAGHLGDEIRRLPTMQKEGIVYKGVWPRERLPDLYRQVHGFVFPTLLDSFGLVLLEAMACGLPVIATSHSAAPDLVTEGKDGYVVPPFSVEALMEAMEKLYRMPLEERLAMGYAARQKVESAWTLTHYAQRIAAYLAEYEL